MSDISITENITQKLKEMQEFDYNKQLGLLGVDAISVINERIEDKIDVNGTPFPKLKKSYADRKEKSRREPVRDLQWTGQMLNAMQSNVKGDKVVIDFGNEKHKKSGSKVNDVAQGNHDRTPFFDLNENEFETLIEKFIIKPFARLING